MTPESFRAALDTIGWGQRELSRRLQCDDRMVRRWAGGALRVPEPIARWLDTLARFHGRHGAPEGWRRRERE